MSTLHDTDRAEPQKALLPVERGVTYALRFYRRRLLPFVVWIMFAASVSLIAWLASLTSVPALVAGPGLGLLVVGVALETGNSLPFRGGREYKWGRWSKALEYRWKSSRGIVPVRLYTKISIFILFAGVCFATWILYGRW